VIRAALLFALVAFLAYAAVMLVTAPGDGLNGAANTLLYPSLFVVAVIVAAGRAVAIGRDRLAWSVITVSLVAWCFAEIYDLVAQPEAYPSLADAGWLAFYPLLYAGLVLLVRRRARQVAGTLWVDGVTASIAGAAIGSAVLLEVVLRTTEGTPREVATNLAYPVGDVLLLSAFFGILALSGWRVERPWVVLGIGVLATTIADGIYLFQLDTYQTGSNVDVLWPMSVLLIAAAGWITARDEAGLLVEGRPLLAVPALCALTGIGILVVDHFHRVNLVAIALAATTLLLVLLRLAFTFRENAQLFALTRHESVTDPLTGLGNRRKLLSDLERILAAEQPPHTLLVIFDLNGFKLYNDRFGHPAGDALLQRLAERFAAVPGPHGDAYRLGGDEFCLVARVGPDDLPSLVDAGCAALKERGEGFEVTTAFGASLLPVEAGDVSHALAVADERLYAQKHHRRLERDPTVRGFLEGLAIREPDLLAHLDGVGELSVAVGARLGVSGTDLDELFRAARLHDLGKLAVPEEILTKRAPLDDREWEFIRQHTIVGERILRASPAFRAVAAIVRSSHENWDGSGYPDRLTGDEIPLAARIIRACDAFSAMTSSRPYRDAVSLPAAVAELERCSGREFDPAVVEALVAHLRTTAAVEAA
jgi:diguanylate cyclase (GGDEF)-like protein